MRYVTQPAMHRWIAALAGASTGLLAWGCAHMQPPPGGTVETAPPEIVEINPPDGTRNFSERDVSITFNRVVNEQPSAANNLADLVTISPSHGDVEVRWRRQTLAIRLSQHWRANTAYRVTLGAGIADLWGNTRKTDTTIVFATGNEIPTGKVTGVLFDWEKGTPVANGFIQLFPDGDSTFFYIARTDSIGRFTIESVAPGNYLARGLIDENGNRGADLAEAFDTATVALRDSADLEFLAVMRDTTGPALTLVTPRDSVTVIATFSSPLDPQYPLDPVQFRVTGPDSAAVLIASVTLGAIEPVPPDTLDTLDTLPPGTDSAVSKAAISDTASRRQAKPSKPLASREVTIIMTRPLRPDTEYVVSATNIVGIGHTSPSVEQRFTTPAAPKASQKSE